MKIEKIDCKSYFKNKNYILKTKLTAVLYLESKFSHFICYIRE